VNRLGHGRRVGDPEIALAGAPRSFRGVLETCSAGFGEARIHDRARNTEGHKAPFSHKGIARLYDSAADSRFTIQLGLIVR